MIKMYRQRLFYVSFSLVLLFLPVFNLCAAELQSELEPKSELVSVNVADAYIDMRSGPAEVYPIVHIVTRGEPIQILFRRTNWYKIIDSNGVQGWVERNQLQKTLTLSNASFSIQTLAQADFYQRHWEFSIMYGNFNGAPVIAAAASAGLTENIALELVYSQVTGDFSSSKIVDMKVMHQPFPRWRLAPYIFLGLGYITTDPKTTLLQVEDRSDQLLISGAGVRWYINERFMFRAEYNNRLVLTSRDENENVDEWLAGFSVFF